MHRSNLRLITDFDGSPAEQAPGKELESPAGEALNNPALEAPRPAFEAVRKTLPQPLRAQLQSARELGRRQRQAAAEALPTASPALDRLLGGGLARGQLVEMVGRRSCGRLSVTLAVLAAATQSGEAAAFIDLGDGLDPQAAAGAGVELERLLWLRPRWLKQALLAAETLLATGFPLVVLDLGLPPVAGGRGAEAAWLRLSRAAREQGAALLISAPYRVSGPAAAVVLAAERGRPAWRGRSVATRLLTELEARLTVEKLRGCAPGETAALQLRPPEAQPEAWPEEVPTEPARPAREWPAPAQPEEGWPAAVRPAGRRPAGRRSAARRGKRVAELLQRATG